MPPRNKATTVHPRDEFIRRIFDEAWSHGETTIVEEGIGDVVFHYGGEDRRTDGRELRSVIDAWREGFPDLTFAVQDLVEGDDRVAVRARLRGTHLGPWRGIAGTGREMDIDVMMFFRWDGGRLVEIWEVDDAARRDRQLGLG